MSLPLVFLMGPTASGKSTLALQLAERFDCEIISVDSALVYRGMDIGTAKPSIEILQRVPHQLINILDPSVSYSVAQFVTDAHMHISAAHSKGKIPVLVGGTMLYFKALKHGLATLPSANPSIRHRLDSFAQTHGLAALHQRLADVDPISASKIHIKDRQRLQRALEVFEITGTSLTELRQSAKFGTLPYSLLEIILAPTDRSWLHRRIDSRFRLMLQQGFVSEVEHLYRRKDINCNIPSMRAVGYRQIWDFLENKLNYQDMVEKSIIATRQLAKRQFTWLRSWDGVSWLDSGDAKIQEIVMRRMAAFITYNELKTTSR